LRPYLGRRSVRRLRCVLTVLAREASRLPRKSEQFSLEMLPQAGRCAVERRADLFVEGQDGSVDYKTRSLKLL
jgi:hypothetical protein